MNNSRFEIILPEALYKSESAGVMYAVVQPEKEDNPNIAQVSGADLGWGGAAAFIIASALILKTIHGSSPE